MERTATRAACRACVRAANAVMFRVVPTQLLAGQV